MKHRKVQTKIKHFFQEYWSDLVTFLVTVSICAFLILYDTGYVIECPGGYADLTDRITVTDGYSSSGSFGMTYVTVRPGNIPVYLLSLVLDSWDAIPESDYTYPNEDLEMESKRGKLEMEASKEYAILNASKEAGKTYEITSDIYYVDYVYLEQEELKSLDEIVSINGVEITSLDSFDSIMDNLEVGDIIPMEVKRDGELLSINVEVHDDDGVKRIGIVLGEKLTVTSDPEVTISSEASEEGPSGGLMLTLAIYNQMVEEDLTHGLKIAGTGEVNKNGDVLTIGGVAYKLAGAVNSGASIFICPETNYEEAISLKESKGYNIDIIGVSSVHEAIERLSTYGE